ncbi:TPA: hypothetical protein ACH3X2_009805 [Trebouxia sp. C0005]
MAGDWNTAYLAKERCTGELQRPADEEHAQILQALQMQPTDEGLEYTSRQHPFYAEGQQQQHSRIDDFTWSKILQTGIRLPLTELRVGQAARKAAMEMRETVRMADETIGSQSSTARLRLNKKEELRAAELTKEMVLNHTNKVSEMLKDVYDSVAHQVFDWTTPGPAEPMLQKPSGKTPLERRTQILG